MARLQILLALLVVVAALALVTSQHQARRLFVQIEREQVVAKRLDVEWGQLKLELAQLGKHSLVDAAARRDLGMVPVTPPRTLYLGGAAEALAVPDPKAAARRETR